MRIFNRRTPVLAESIILLYHRVANVKDDPHKLSVSPENFKAQLKAMERILPPVSLQQIVVGIKSGHPVRGFAVSFDDGYSDNFTNALPILVRLKVPATIFVVSGKVDATSPYEWDEQTAKLDRGRAMSKIELSQVDSSPLIEIGAHTVNHPHLGKSSPKIQKTEIENSKQELEKILGHKISGLAYPFGASGDDFTDQTKTITKEAGFDYACINIRGKIGPDFDGFFGLPRVLIRDWSPKQMLEEIKDVLPQ